uniref:BACK domain-containing protein n=1 Tax=Panagrellus redivivus TaxID=6233 RepID=A0A7E4UTV9_PANRE
MMWNGKRCFSSPTFKQLSPEALEYLLKLRLDEHESTIFKSLVKWMRNNLEHKALFPKFLEHIDLCLIKKKLLDKLFKPQQLIDRNFYENLLKEHQNKANTVQKVVNQNVITGTDDLRIIEGYKFWRREWDTVYLYACIVNPRFIIDLKQQNLLNCIKLTLLDEASYVVSVSKDMCDWERVVDHSDYLCFGPQVLYFEERAFRFIRIQCNARFLKVDPNIEALHSTGPFEIDPITTLIMPNQNIVPTEMEYACSNTANGYIEGNIMNGYVMHWMDNNSRIIFQFSQPYLIGSIKLLLNYTSSYSVAIYANGERFTRIFDEKNVSGWRTVTFPKQPVMCIKIVGFKAPSHTFRLHKLECPAT